MLKAWVGTVLLAEDDWFYSSSTPSSAPPGWTFETSTADWKARKQVVGDAEGYHMQPVNGAYQCLAIDLRLCRFDLSSTRLGANGCVVTTRFLPSSIGGHDLYVLCKVVDVLRYPNAAILLDGEACAHAALQDLQGEVILTLHGFYEVCGILQFLALEPVGNAISEDKQIDHTLRTKMKAALQHIHDAGFIHSHHAS